MVSLPQRFVVLAAVVALLVAACGGGDEAVTPSSVDASASTAVDRQNSDAPVDEDENADTPAASTTATDAADESDGSEQPSGPDGDPAPDFTLALADGSSFSPSAETKPIYMVFWAEW